MLGELLHLLRALEKRSASAAVTDSIAHRLANPVASSPIQSIQRGTITVAPGANGTASATATITSVNTAKAAAHWLGYLQTAGLSQTDDSCSRVELTNATTVTAYASNSTGSSLKSYDIGYAVVEYK